MTFLSKKDSLTTSIIGKAIKVNGNFIGDGDVIVEGEVKGSLKTKSDIQIGPEALITADIIGDNIMINGHIKGSIKAKNKVTLNKSAVVLGDISAKTISIEEGAVIQGKCVCGSEEGSEKTTVSKS